MASPLDEPGIPWLQSWGVSKCAGATVPAAGAHRRRLRSEEEREQAMRRIAALIRLVISRSIATPGLLAIRLFGVLVAVTLVAGVSLYSTALGDAMLQGSLSRDQGSLYLAAGDDTGKPLVGATYARLDRYIRYREPNDLGLPLYGLYVHHNTSTEAVYRV